MATDFTTIREHLSDRMGDGLRGTTTSAGAAGGTTALDTALAVYDDDAFNDNYYLLCVDGKNADEVRPVSDFVGSTGTITVARAFTNQVASDTAYELHKYHPNDYKLAVNIARSKVYPNLYTFINDTSIVIGNRLANSDFEDAVKAEWVEVNSPTVTFDRLWKRSGKRSLKLIAGSSVGSYRQQVAINIEKLTTKDVTLAFWVRALAASTARVGIDWDGGTTVDYTSYHTGADQWERLKDTFDVPDGATQCEVILQVAASGMAWFDAGYLVDGTTILRYKLPGTLKGIPNWVSVGSTIKDPDSSYNPHRFVSFDEDYEGKYINFVPEELPSQGSRIKVIGKGVLSEVVDEVSFIELDSPQLEVFEEMAYGILNGILGAPGHHAAGDPTDFLNREKLAIANAERDLFDSRRGIRMPGIPTLEYRSYR